MKKYYKFDPEDHGSLVDAVIDFAEDFCRLVESRRWAKKDQLKKLEELKRCFGQFRLFEDAYIQEWNNSVFPFHFSDLYTNVPYLINEVTEDGKPTLDKAVETLKYHLHWYSDRMNQNRLLGLHLYWLLVMELANDFSEESCN